MPLNERTGKQLRFSDREVCKYELAGLCPYGLFRNTKSDLGKEMPQCSTCCDNKRCTEHSLPSRALQV